MPVRDDTPPPSEEEMEAGLAFMKAAHPDFDVSLMECRLGCFSSTGKDESNINGWVHRPDELPENARIEVNKHGGFVLKPKVLSA